jgi:hypothetical protein
VKSRLTRGREALRCRLAAFVAQSGDELGIKPQQTRTRSHETRRAKPMEAEIRP